MWLILRSKRYPDMRPWNDRPVWKRFFNRLLYLTTLGNVSILITFLQIALEFTQWDVYLELGFLGVLNANVEGIGLQCIFPFIATPMASLLIRLSIPFVSIGIVVLSVGIASLMAKFLEAREAKRFVVSVDESSDVEEEPMLKTTRVYVPYPAKALLTSTSLTVLKFFYFGTALTAHEYIFWVTQQSTGIRYLQNDPWMRWSEATRLIVASIPAIIIFDLGLPILFFVMSMLNRRSLHTPEVQIYFAPLFRIYTSRCFWWEMVSTLRKLAIALALQALPDSDAVQIALIVSIIAFVLMLQVTFDPWRRKIENLSDSLSSLLLIGAFLTTRAGRLTHAVDVIYYVAALSIAFILGNIGILIWETVTAKPDADDKFEHLLGKVQPPRHGNDSWASSLEGWTTEEETKHVTDIPSDHSLTFDDPPGKVASAKLF